MSRLVFPLLAAAALVLVGCRDKQVTAYRVPKEKEAEKHFPGDGHDHGEQKGGAAAAPAQTAPASGGNNMANTAVATTSGAALTWTAPPHWQAKSGSAMRKGTFIITGEGNATAELAITAFPGDVGGEVANVNRWRGQIQLAPLPEAQVPGSITRVEANGLKIGVVDIVNPAGATPTRVLGAMVPHAGSTWFFKLTGPDALVAKEKAAFLNFLQTVKPAP